MHPWFSLRGMIELWRGGRGAQSPPWVSIKACTTPKVCSMPGSCCISVVNMASFGLLNKLRMTGVIGIGMDFGIQGGMFLQGP